MLRPFQRVYVLELSAWKKEGDKTQMKELMYRAIGSKHWTRHYSRPNDHPDVKEWEAWIAHYGSKSPYKIRTIPDEVEGETAKP